MPTSAPVRAVLFDFIGTLVTYEPGRVDLDYPDTALLLYRWGHGNACERFSEVWNGVLRTLELTTSRSLEEFSMTDVVLAYGEAEQLDLTADHRTELLNSFLTEWRVGVRPIDGVREMLAALSDRVRLGIVSNTHQSTLVLSLVDEFGLGGVFDPTVLSIEHGHRKPHATIYQAALDGLRRRLATNANQVDHLRSAPAHPDLPHMDLSQSDLSQAEFSQAELSHPDLPHTDLLQSDLSQAEFSQAELSQSVRDQVAPPAPEPMQPSSTRGSPRSGAGLLDPGNVMFVGDSYEPDYAGPMAAGFQARLIDPDHRFDIPSEHRLRSVLDLIHEIDAL